MRNHGLFAFVLTTSILVPTAAHYLTAGRDQVARFAAPTSNHFQLDGARVEARLERPLVEHGAPLKIKLAAHGATGKRLAVGVLVYGSSGTEGGRVPGPPIAVAHETVTLAIDAEGTGEKELAISLVGGKTNWGSAEPFVRYEVLVMAPKSANRLAALHRGTRLIGDINYGIPSYNKTGDKFMRVYGGWGEPEGADKQLFAEGVMVRLDAHTRSANKLIAVEMPPKVEVGKGFDVFVTVTNPTRRKLEELELDLATVGGVSADAKGIAARVMPAKKTFDLAAGETKRFDFRVSADTIGILGMYAKVDCSECKADALTKKATFDAVEIATAEPANTIVGRK
jgi:hypothetical protein